MGLVAGHGERPELFLNIYRHIIQEIEAQYHGFRMILILMWLSED